MTISQALKKKNKIVSEINKLWAKINQHNSTYEGSVRPYDIKKLYSDVITKSSELVALKVSIHEASAPVRHKIFFLSEMKSSLNHIKSIPTNEGVERYSSSATPTVLTCVLNISWQDTEIELFESQIEQLQEELDKFNHNTNV
jgi:hypothetical protein